jgi:Ni/Co efflux regulator RcnB
MKTLRLAAVALSTCFVLGAAPIAAHADAGDRIERRLDRRGDRIDRRLDRRAAIAEANGHPLRAERLDRKGDRIDARLDRRGHRIERRLDRRGL